jgi:hypothetical protein
MCTVIPGLAQREPGTQGPRAQIAQQLSLSTNAAAGSSACGPWLPGSAYGRPGMTVLGFAGVVVVARGCFKR